MAFMFKVQIVGILIEIEIFFKFKMEVKFAFRSAIVKIIYMFIRAILFKVESANYVKYSY